VVPVSEANDLLATARQLDPAVRSFADRAETERRLPRALADQLRDAGLFRMCVPSVYGGPEANPMTMVRAIAAVSESDGAAGWCTMIASTTSSLASFLPESAAQLIFGNPLLVSGGAVSPNGTAVSVGGGWRVSGRWAWGSGTSHCDWIVGGALTDTGEYRLMFMPAAEVKLLDTWYSSGLKGTGSTDFTATDVFVPTHCSVQPGVDRSVVDSPLARFPNFTLLAAGVAATLLGIARRAVNEITDLAQGKVPAFSSKTLATSSLAQVDIARAEAAVSAGFAFLLDELAAAWDVAVSGGKVDVAQRLRVRLAAVHAAHESARAVDLAYHLCGGSSVYSANVLQRCFRDVHVATQHLQVSTKVLETIGRTMVNLDTDTSLL
jgi:indole-3-acetate monooxygenase